MSSSTRRDLTIYVAPDGDDRASGSRHKPLRTPHAALRAVRRRRREEGITRSVEVILRGGTYFLSRPLVFRPRDSGCLISPETKVRGPHPAQTVTWRAHPRETPIFSGGRKITGWKPATVNGHRAWVAQVPGAPVGKWAFHQLWVNGQRMRLTRVPEAGLFRITGLPGTDFSQPWQTLRTAGTRRFEFREDDIRAWRNPQDIDFVGLHFWISSRRRIKHIDPSRRVVTLNRKTRYILTDDHTQNGAEYYLENVFEALSLPGQFYLERASGKLYVIPLPGVDMREAEVIAPYLEEVLRLQGGTAPFTGSSRDRARNAGRPVPRGKPVEFLRFEGIGFSHCEWRPSNPAEGSATPQAACHVPAAVMLDNSRNIRFSGCTVAHGGGYGIELAAGCSDVTLSRCAVHDLGAGGVKIWHGCRRNTVTDCHISDGGYRYHAGVGVLVGKSSGNRLIHNHVHDFDYSGFSIGWTWGYAEGGAYGNIIEFNHVHDIGRGVLSDMGGIYTLGVSPGTRIRFNVFHDINSRGYGGWGIYTDEGSTDILIEHNLVYRTKSGGFHQHYGRDNIVQNNIFAFAAQSQLQRSRLEGHTSFIFRRNIVIFDNDKPLCSGPWIDESGSPQAEIDGNIYFNLAHKPLRVGELSLKEWRAAGADRHSLVTDPRFVDPLNDDFQLQKGSPAYRIGFVPFDYTMAGIREDHESD